MWAGLAEGAEPNSSAAKLVRFEETQPKMGTTATITFYANDTPIANRAMSDAFAEIDRLNMIFSNYESESELNRLSRSAPHDRPVKISRELFEVLRYSRQLSQRSSGAFDITIGPLSRLWRRARRRRELPTAEQLAAAKRAVGFNHLHLDKQGNNVRLTAEEMQLDVGSVAKGLHR